MTDLVQRLRELRGKITPGPWRSPMNKSRSAFIVREQDSSRIIGNLSWNDHSPFFTTQDQAKANAELIALAPEMDTALEQSTLEIKEYREALECISVISTNHGGWFENGSWEWGQMMGRIAGEALSRAALNHHEGSER